MTEITINVEVLNSYYVHMCYAARVAESNWDCTIRTSSSTEEIKQAFVAKITAQAQANAVRDMFHIIGINVPD